MPHMVTRRTGGHKRTGRRQGADPAPFSRRDETMT
jgi:hypothetical protein